VENAMLADPRVCVAVLDGPADLSTLASPAPISGGSIRWCHLVDLPAQPDLPHALAD
jgi:hypothetical protein